MLALTIPAAQAQSNLKIGVIATLSGPPAVLGQQLRNGFALAVKDLGGKLGGVDTEIVVADDELKPDVAVSKVKALIERDKVDFVIGPIFSNILGAIEKPVTEAGVILISPNAGTSTFAGKECNPNLFVTSYQNDQVHEVLGQYAQDSGIKKVIVIVPNYQAGKDAAAGFKHKFSGEVLDEMYVPLGQLDYSAELSRIAAAKPDAIFAFLPGGMGVNFVKQFRQAGLADKITFLSAFTVDESTLPAQKEAALGMYGGANWAPNLDNPQNKAFVDAYLKDYDAVPATYAFQAYDTALLIDSAVKAVKGNVADKDALRAALKKADFKSLRGGFKFNSNHYPIQDFYLVKVAQRPDGKFETEIVKKVFTDYGDAFAKDCPMK
ncbi:MAG TPA: ABC transporter substrate-binding protein [Xanthobacteraceae bacterium]|nr:ABC transporter substrate-binding protein [Xanthobacteraceae bacterium]